ncbi:MAG: glycosyltransferase family 39 protein, partial [Patescibacteria group bacterium]
MKKKIFWIFLFGLLVRLIALDQSFWLDEAVTANVVATYSYSEIITKFSPTDFHPPLFYFIEKFWTDIFGYSEIALRFPSIIFSLIAAYVIYLIGWKVAPLRSSSYVGVTAAALFLFNPLIIYYSQEARPYMLVTMFVTLIVYYLLRINPTLLKLRGASGLTDFKGKRHPGASETSDRIYNIIQRFYQSLRFFQNDKKEPLSSSRMRGSRTWIPN